MNTTTIRCRCGRPAETTPAVLAAGGNHPACVIPAALRASLTASAGPGSPEGYVMARWAARVAQGHAERRRAAEARRRPRVNVAAATAKPLAPTGPAAIVNADRLLQLIEHAGVGASTLPPQRALQRTVGREAAARAWSTLVARGVLRISDGRQVAPRILGIDRAKWAAARAELLQRPKAGRR